MGLSGGLATNGAAGLPASVGLASSLLLPPNVDPVGAVGQFSAYGAHQIVGIRCIVPRTGTLHDLTMVFNTVSGNVMVAVYDTGDAAAGVRTLLASSGSVVIAASGGGVNWQNIYDPSLVVTQGQHVDLAFMVDNGTATIGARLSPATVQARAQLPTGYLPAAGGALPKLYWTFQPGSFAWPGTISEANCALTVANGQLFHMMGRIA